MASLLRVGIRVGHCALADVIIISAIYKNSTADLSSVSLRNKHFKNACYIGNKKYTINDQFSRHFESICNLCRFLLFFLAAFQLHFSYKTYYNNIIVWILYLYLLIWLGYYYLYNLLINSIFCYCEYHRFTLLYFYTKKNNKSTIA